MPVSRHEENDANYCDRRLVAVPAATELCALRSAVVRRPLLQGLPVRPALDRGRMRSLWPAAWRTAGGGRLLCCMPAASGTIRKGVRTASVFVSGRQRVEGAQVQSPAFLRPCLWRASGSVARDVVSRSGFAAARAAASTTTRKPGIQSGGRALSSSSKDQPLADNRQRMPGSIYKAPNRTRCSRTAPQPESGLRSPRRVAIPSSIVNRRCNNDRGDLSSACKHLVTRRRRASQCAGGCARCFSLIRKCNPRVARWVFHRATPVV